MSPDQRRTLETWIRAHNTPQRIVLLAADGLSNVQAAREADVSRPTVILWRQRFLRGGPDALTTILPGRGRPVTYTAEQVQRIVEATTQTKPPGATHWSTRSMARALGHQQGYRAAYLVRSWPATPSDEAVQALQ